jgi:hypothetical protein
VPLCGERQGYIHVANTVMDADPPEALCLADADARHLRHYEALHGNHGVNQTHDPVRNQCANPCQRHQVACQNTGCQEQGAGHTCCNTYGWHTSLWLLLQSSSIAAQPVGTIRRLNAIKSMLV